MKWQTAQRIIRRDRPTVALQIGDHDHWGKGILLAMTGDVEAFVNADPEGPAFRALRIVVTDDQIERLSLPASPPTDKDDKVGWQEGTVQAEALTPVQLATEVEAAIRTVMDPDILEAAVEREASERAAILGQLDDLDGTG